MEDMHCTIIILLFALFADKFLPFKTPLDARYSDQIPEESRFDLDMLFASLKSFKVMYKI